MNGPILVGIALDAAPDQSNLNAAVLRCAEAYRRSREVSSAKHQDGFDTELQALIAYREAMPHLYGREGIRDFIACAAYGMVNSLIDLDAGTKMLYAAQVALGALHQETLAVRDETKGRSRV